MVRSFVLRVSTCIDERGKHYLIEGIRDKLTSFQRIDRLFEIARRAKNLKWVSYEVIGGRHGDLEVINQKMQTEQFFFFVKEIKSATLSKIDRIEQRLVPLYHSGTVYLPRESYFKSLYDGKVYNFTEQLKLEYLQFPFTEHDDILDCQAQIMR
jgi:phage terminase large subunit-like protein